MDARSGTGQTPLHCAVEKGFSAAVAALLEARADVNAQTTDEDRLSPLDSAIEHDCFDLAQMLIARGARPDLKGKFDRTPIHRAAWTGRTSFFKLFKRESLDIVDKLGYTPLRWAVEKGNVALVTLLLLSGASICLSDETGRPLAEMAREFGYHAIAECLRKHESSPAVPVAHAFTDELSKESREGKE